MPAEVVLFVVVIGVMLWMVAKNSHPPHYSAETFMERLRELVAAGEFSLAFRFIEDEVPGINPRISCSWIVETWLNQNPGFPFCPRALHQLLLREGFAPGGIVEFETKTAIYFIG